MTLLVFILLIYNTAIFFCCWILTLMDLTLLVFDDAGFDTPVFYAAGFDSAGFNAAGFCRCWFLTLFVFDDPDF